MMLDNLLYGSRLLCDFHFDKRDYARTWQSANKNQLTEVLVVSNEYPLARQRQLNRRFIHGFMDFDPTQLRTTHHVPSGQAWHACYVRTHIRTAGTSSRLPYRHTLMHLLPCQRTMVIQQTRLDVL